MSDREVSDRARPRRSAELWGSTGLHDGARPHGTARRYRRGQDPLYQEPLYIWLDALVLLVLIDVFLVVR